MSCDFYGDLETFLHDTDGRIFKYWVYKKVYTPYEQDAKFFDESIYESNECTYGIIREVIPIGDDLLVGFNNIYDEQSADDLTPTVNYYKLSDICLEYSPKDEKEIRDEWLGCDEGEDEDGD